MKLTTLLICSFLITNSFGQDTPTNDSNKELPFMSIEDAGFNRDSIENLIDRISITPQRNFRGLVVLKDNHIVIEEYFCGIGENNISDIRSAGKSITALLLGIAMKDGLIDSLDQSIYSLFSEEKNPKINEDYKKITLRNVLDMSSGLDADSDDWKSYGIANKWIGKDNWKDFLLNVPKKTKPGKNFVYADINALLVGLAIEEASGMSLRDYAKTKLFDPLGIKQFYWLTNESNQTGAAGNLYLTPLDFAKLGLLITNEGIWGAEQIINTDYIDELVSSKNPAIGDWFFLADTYGMFWYKATRTYGTKEREYLIASGNGGNQLVVFPNENMVIALASSAYGQGYAHGRSYAIMKKLLEAMD